MKNVRTTIGFSLTEVLVVMAVLALLVGVGTKAAKQVMNSFKSATGGRYVIELALARARAMAASTRENKTEQGMDQMAGVRFQKDYLTGKQYMIYIVYDPDDYTVNPLEFGTGLKVGGFRAAPGLEPVELPEGTGVMDLRLRNKTDIKLSGDIPVNNDSLIDEQLEIDDATTFSIIFSSTGKLVMHDVRIRNKHGYVDSASNTNVSDDKIFNKKAQVDTGDAMFYQDDYIDPSDGVGLGQEWSRNSFVIYDISELNSAGMFTRYSNYLKDLPLIYVNQFTGELIY